MIADLWYHTIMELDLSLLLFQLAIIFLPGALWERLDAQFAAMKMSGILPSTRRSRMLAMCMFVISTMVISMPVGSIASQKRVGCAPQIHP